MVFKRKNKRLISKTSRSINRSKYTLLTLKKQFHEKIIPRIITDNFLFLRNLRSSVL